jgi:hypothetical protein
VWKKGFVLFCFHDIEVLNSDLCARQAFYHLSHAFGHLCSGYFGDKISLFAQASLD